MAEIDFLCGGFPCQPVSLAGHRLGEDDERWLWPEFAETIRLVGPRFVLLENTPGLFTSGFGRVMGDLAALGLDAEWSVLSACALGAPHTRERVFILGYATSESERGYDRQGRPRGRIEIPGERLGDARAHWASEPDVERVALRVPNGVDRNRGIGNAVVPWKGELIGRRILESTEQA